METMELDIETTIEMAKDEARDATVADILIDLEDWTSEFTGAELDGFRAAMQVIRANYQGKK